MTVQKSFKRLVRTRMDKTGESYTAARAMLLAADEPKADDRPRVGGVVQPAGRLGRPAALASRDRALDRRAAGSRAAGVERPVDRGQLRALTRAPGAG